jgi:hypothetical protein
VISDSSGSPGDGDLDPVPGFRLFGQLEPVENGERRSVDDPLACPLRNALPGITRANGVEVDCR